VFTQGQDLQLQIWDTAGQERFLSLTQSYLRGAAAALVVFDVTSRESFEHLEHWFRCTQIEPDMVLFLIGNKCDLVEARKVSTDDARRTATARNIKYYETSTVVEKELPVDLLLTNLGEEVLNRQSLRSVSSHGVVGLSNTVYESYRTEGGSNGYYGKRQRSCCYS